MSYLPTSAGHTAREATRAITQETIDELLVERAHTWLLESRNWYNEASQMTKEIKTTASIASMLVFHPILRQHPRYENIGTFISALWNEHCPETIIVYPHITPDVKWIGEALPVDKILIITGEVSSTFGFNARGIVITQNAIRSPTQYLTQEEYQQYTRRRTYVGRLLTKARKDPATIEQEFGNAEKITAEIQKRLRSTARRSRRV